MQTAPCELVAKHADFWLYRARATTSDEAAAGELRAAADGESLAIVCTVFRRGTPPRQSHAGPCTTRCVPRGAETSAAGRLATLLPA